MTNSATSKADEIWDNIMGNIDIAASFIKENGSESWTRLKNLVGREEAINLAKTPRNELINYLRVQHGFTLQTIADVFDLSRERIRQLTPDGLWAPNSKLVQWASIIKRVAKAATGQRNAWNKKGRIKRVWILEHFGEDVARHLPDIHRTMNKMEMILLYRVHLEDRKACLAWLNEQYFKQGRTYKNIADYLSQYVPISTMCVHRDAAAIGFKGYASGRRFDLP